MRRWLASTAIVLVGLTVGGFQWADGQPLAAVIAVVASTGLSWWFYRLMRPGPHVDLDQAPADHVVVFWKPGCLYCVRLLERFEDSERISWVNIRKDPLGAEFVREHNSGNELTPTVRVPGGGVISSPTPDGVGRLLDSSAG